MAASRGVELLVEAPPGPTLVLGNPTALGRIIRNLVDNAIRHSPPGAAVHVSVASEGRPSVRVRDEGAGFPPSFAGRAFDRFSRAVATSGSTPARERRSRSCCPRLLAERGPAPSSSTAWTLLNNAE
jgi:signal transduction histidine kinase